MGQVVVLGLIGGGIYALFALSVVMVYRGTGVLSFAQGEIGTASLFLAAFLITDHGAPWVVGAVLAIAFAVLIGAAFEFAVVRRMVGSDPVSVAVATIGLTLTILSIEIVAFGADIYELRPPVDGGFDLFGVSVKPHQVLALVLALGLGFGLQSLLRRTDFGLGILAAAQDPTAVRLVGAPLSRITLTVWGLGAGLASIASLLVEPTVGVFNPGYAGEIYIGGLVAAVIGRLTSLPGAVVGGLVLGLSESFAVRYLGDVDIPALKYVVYLVVLLAVLLGRQAWPDLKRRLEAANAPVPTGDLA